MNAIRIRKKVESETLQLPELKPLIGKTVEITVEEAAPVAAGNRWDEVDRIAEKNAKLYGIQDAAVDIVREMRDGRNFQGDA